MDVVKRLTVTLAAFHLLADPAGARPALSTAVYSVPGTESPGQPVVVDGLDIADLNKEMPMAAQLEGDLPIQTALVLFYNQGHVGHLLGGQLKYAAEVCSASFWISTPSSSNVLRLVLSDAPSWDSPVSYAVWVIATPSPRA